MLLVFLRGQNIEVVMIKSVAMAIIINSAVFYTVILAQGANARPYVFVYYVPFEFATFVPVTEKSIEKDAICTFRLSRSSQQAKRLATLFNTRTTGKFSNKHVRLKVSGIFEKPVFADQYGGMRMAAHDAALKKPAFGQLTELMRSMHSKDHANCKLPFR